MARTTWAERPFNKSCSLKGEMVWKGVCRNGFIYEGRRVWKCMLSLGVCLRVLCACVCVCVRDLNKNVYVEGGLKLK